MNEDTVNVALIQCPLWGTFDPPIGLAQLSSYLKKQGHQVMSLDLNIKLYLNQGEDRRDIWAWEEGDFWYQPERVKKFFSDNSRIIDYYVEQILKYNVSIAGFSVNAASRLSSLEFARRIKARDKKITIVFGGPIFLRESFINDVLREECVDIVIPGEGLLAFSDLVTSFKLGKKIDSCKGLVFKRDENIVSTGTASLVDLNILPFLDIDDLPLKDYDKGDHISLMTSRGCVRRCVFCSDAPCWSGYRAMSGRRIFEEVKFLKDRQRGVLQVKSLGHVDFMDLIFNGNMDSLVEFCDLMIEGGLDLAWTANMYIRPEMTLEVIKKIKAAGCEHIIIGIESGSERVLKLMNKHYSMRDADRIIREMYEAGICVTANFMFGFPGEAEDDFALTLDFLRRNARYIGAYPSRTYCALEEFSYLEAHRGEFGIKSDSPNHLFWESADGTNSYPVRMDRCRRFCELALELGVEITAGVQTAVQLDEWFNIGCYYEFKRDHPKAIANFLNYARENPTGAGIKNKLLSYQKILPGLDLNKNIKSDFEKTIDVVLSGRYLKKKVYADRPLSPAFVKMQIDKLSDEVERFNRDRDSGANDPAAISALIGKIHKVRGYYRMLSEQQQHRLSCKLDQLMQKVNARELNQSGNAVEFKEKKVWMETLPLSVYLPLVGGGNDFYYTFEPPGEIQNRLTLEQFNREYKDINFDFLLSWTKRCVFKGAGGFSLNREGGEILDYFEERYPHLEKEFFTNGVDFSEDVVSKISSYPSDYIINFALHASNRDLHRKISNKDNFDDLIANLRLLSGICNRSKNVILNIVSTVTAFNITDLPNIIKLASEFNVDRVIVDYNRIYNDENKDISCFFKQDLTNEIFDIVEAQSKSLDLHVQLPPKFNQDFYPESAVCRMPWTRLVLNPEGKVFPCEHFQSWDTSFKDKLSFKQAWNNAEYKIMRACFGARHYFECSMFCYYVNPKRVNSLRSHVYNAKQFCPEDSQKCQKGLRLDLDDHEMEKAVDLAEFVMASGYFSLSERIIERVLDEMKFPSRPLRLLAALCRRKAELSNSSSDRERFLALAQKNIARSLAEWSFDSWALAEAAHIYSALGDHKKAMEAIKGAISLEPQEKRFKLLEQELTKGLS